jgi:hypothetical protein
VSSLDELTSISVTTTEYAGQPATLPARSCQLVVIAKPIDARAHLAYNHRFVYSIFDLEIVQVLKGKPDGSAIVAAQLGGSIRFLSGHEAAFLEANDGFMGLGQRYLLFLWRPVAAANAYMTADAFLLHDNRVYPIELAIGQSRYSGMPIATFIKKVKTLIAQNVDAS